MSECSNCSNCSKGGGNTKSPPLSISPSKRWSFTVFNLSDDNIKNIIDVFNCSKSSCILGREICPGTNKLHLQCYCEFSKKVRPKNLFLDNTIHWEKSKGNRIQNIDYCAKDGDVIYSNFKYNKPIKILKKDDLYEWENNILDIIDKEPDDREIYWYYGKSGRNGKTSFCKYLVMECGAIILSGKASDIKNAIVEYKKSNDCLPELICINIPKSFNSDFLSYSGIEEIKDMLFYSGKYEGGMICGNAPHIFIFSNVIPDIYKCSLDRWKIFDIEKNKWIHESLINGDTSSDEDD